MCIFMNVGQVLFIIIKAIMEKIMKHITRLIEVLFLVLKSLLLVIIKHFDYNIVSVLFQFFHNKLGAVKILLGYVRLGTKIPRDDEF